MSKENGMKLLLTYFFVFFAWICSPALAEEPATPSRFTRRWVYPHPGFDLRNDQGTQQFIDLIERSKKAGYNGVCVVTHAPYVTPPPDAYFQNMERVRAAAERLEIE